MSNPATMENIYYWRNKLRETQHALDAAHEQDLPVGARVSYLHGNNEIIVEIIKTYHHVSRMRVRNPETKREYMLDYDAVHRVIAQPQA